MKSTTTLLGLFIIILGISMLVYQGFTYTKHEQIAQIGNLNVSANTQKTVYFPPVVGGLLLVAGIVVVVIGIKKGG